MEQENRSGWWERNYFVLVKFGYVLLMAAYILLHSGSGYLGSALTLAAAAVSACVIVLYEITSRKRRKTLLLVAEFVCVLLGMYCCGGGFALLLPLAVCDMVSLLDWQPYWLLTPLAGLAAAEDSFIYLTLCLLTAVLYWQHGGMILRYRKSAEQYEEQELRLKDSLETGAADFRNELRRTNLYYENVMLQDKARLTQALHDKLGHRINGSVYQLEACRAIAGSDPVKADEILVRVTDSLREGMDEIRAVLRSERPDGKRRALLGLNLLCEECKNQYGIDAQLTVEGDSGRIEEKMWSVIYDNCCEAVTNSMKYAGCTRMHIEIKVLNQILRCCVSDNGIGCEEIHDGMGLEGIRRRVAELGGTVHMSGDGGFTINMLIPLSEGEKSQWQSESS